MAKAKSIQHDVVVIGAGPGGYVAAIRAAQLGLDTACIEKETALGGTCLRVGCIPSKALLEASERYKETRSDLKRFGVLADNVRFDLDAMMKHKSRVVTANTKGIDGLFGKNKITRYHGHGRLDGPGSVIVEGDERTRIEAKHVILATGSYATSIPGVDLDGDRIGTSDQAIAYADVPEHLVVIGAGVIGLELGSVWARLGAKVTVLEYLDTILPGMDAETAKLAQRLFKKQKLAFQLGARVTGARVEGEGCIVEVDGRDPIACDRVLVAVGRRAYTDDLGLQDRRGRPPRRAAERTQDRAAGGQGPADRTARRGRAEDRGGRSVRVAEMGAADGRHGRSPDQP